jgi:hypothetical protein
MQGKEGIQTGDKNTATGREKNTRIRQLPVACKGRAEAQYRYWISIQGDDRYIYRENSDTK